MTKEKDPEPNAAVRELSILGHIYELEWKQLTEAQALKLIDHGTSHDDLLDLLDDGDAETGLIDNLTCWLDDEQVSIDDCLCTDPETRIIGEQGQWMLCRREWHKGSFGITLSEAFDAKKLTFSADLIQLRGKEQPEAMLLTAYYDKHELERLGSDCKSAEWCLIDPEGKDHEFEIFWDTPHRHASASKSLA